MSKFKKKKINPYLVALSVILPTFFAVLGTSATNVAMKHIAGFLGATQYETNTVITTYLIANAMVLPLSSHRSWARHLVAGLLIILAGSGYF